MKRLLPSLITFITLAACSGNPPPASPGGSPFPGAVAPGPAAGSGSAVRQVPALVDPTPPPIISRPEAVTGAPLGASLEAINDNSPFKPVFFQYDSDTLGDEARRALADNATVLQASPSWVVMIEGHCDERGTPEYNLALGDRRALAAKTYLVSLGIAADRIRTVSYGKEFPFDPGHDESAWTLNRRAHFMLTAR